MRRIYLDSAPVIYLVEKATPFDSQVQALLQPDDWIVVSQLTRLECRVLPMRLGDLVRLSDFDAFFAEYADEVVPISEAVIDKATEIRAVYRYTSIDALHLAAAVVSGCDAFVTNDLRLANFSEISACLLKSYPIVRVADAPLQGLRRAHRIQSACRGASATRPHAERFH